MYLPALQMSALNEPELRRLGGGGTRSSRHLVSTEEFRPGSVIFFARRLMPRNIIGLMSSMRGSQDSLFTSKLRTLS